MIGGNRILVRNLEPNVLQALEKMAGSSDRSLEAEARHALRAWVQPLLVSKERSERRAEVAQRLETALMQVNEAARQQWRPSHVAQGAGEGLAGPVEDWFLGREEPTFEQLGRVAEFLGVNTRWLHHGDGQPFPVSSVRLSEDPGQAVRWLLNVSESSEYSLGAYEPPPLPEMKRLILVRSADEAGALAIIKQRDSYRCTTYTTPTHVSHVIGNGGEAQLMALAVTLELLYKLYTRAGTIMVKSWIISEKSFSALLSGKIHPLSLEGARVERTWWEDFWDQDMAGKNEYWIGWREISSRISRSVDDHKWLSKERAQIRAGTHPVLSSLSNPR